MARFHLHIRDGTDLIKDPAGIDLPDLAAARAEALAGVRSILSGHFRVGEVLSGQQIEIMDETGVLLATVPFRDTIGLARA